MVTDAIFLAWTYGVTHLVWAAHGRAEGDDRAFSPTWITVSVVLFVIWMAALAAAATRDERVLGAGPDEYKRIVSSTLFVFGFIALVGYGLAFVIPRPYVVIALPLGLLLLTASRWTWRQWMIVQRREGRMTDPAIVVGSARSVGHLIETIHAHWHSGYRVIGACVEGGGQEDAWINGVPVIGGVDDVARCAREAGVPVVVVASSEEAHPEMVRRLGWDLEGLDIDLMVAPALANIAGPRVHVRPVAGVPLLHVERPAYQGAERWIKAAFDRLGSLFLLVVFSPLLVALTIGVTITSHGPAFFVQERVGRDGRRFGMLKFRSMVVGADQMLAGLVPDAGNDLMFKMKDDPRVTRFGAFLRRHSLDELPQLFNVLVGDMSLVGPRPPLPVEVEAYEADAQRRLLVRPGITGPWQISGRSDLDWEETVRLDLYYVENWSLVGDLLILAKTLRAVLSSQGAY